MRPATRRRRRPMVTSTTLAPSSLHTRSPLPTPMRLPRRSTAPTADPSLDRVSFPDLGPDPVTEVRVGLEEGRSNLNLNTGLGMEGGPSQRNMDLVMEGNRSRNMDLVTAGNRSRNMDLVMSGSRSRKSMDLVTVGGPSRRSIHHLEPNMVPGMAGGPNRKNLITAGGPNRKNLSMAGSRSMSPVMAVNRSMNPGMAANPSMSPNMAANPITTPGMEGNLSMSLNMEGNPNMSPGTAGNRSMRPDTVEGLSLDTKEGLSPDMEEGRRSPKMVVGRLMDPGMRRSQVTGDLRKKKGTAMAARTRMRTVMMMMMRRRSTATSTTTTSTTMTTMMSEHEDSLSCELDSCLISLLNKEFEACLSSLEWFYITLNNYYCYVSVSAADG